MHSILMEHLSMSWWEKSFICTSDNVSMTAFNLSFAYIEYYAQKLL
jgi:hypothetical protein